jgi:dTDP-4-dehydrorhamnose 3,5-epimerase
MAISTTRNDPRNAMSPSLQIEDTKINGCRKIIPSVFYDFRGEYVETFNRSHYSDICPREFIEDDISMSRRHVLRGLHGDPTTWKLIQCLHGEILFTVLDCRDDSPTRGRWQQWLLGDRNRWQVLVPAGCANGHFCLTESCVFSYKQTTYYKDQAQFSVNYASCGIPWPLESGAIISQRDREAKLWAP